MSKHGTLAQRVGFGPSRTTTQPTPTASATTQPHPLPGPRDTSTGIDARQLTPDQYEQRLGQLGLSPPGTEHRRLAPPLDPEVQRLASRDLDRAERRAARGQARELEARTAAVSAGSIDAREASPEEVRARMAALGFESTDLTVRPVGRELEPTRDQTGAHERQTQLAADREVARHVHKAMQVGQRVDAKKLFPGELRALLEIRGAGI